MNNLEKQILEQQDEYEALENLLDGFGLEDCPYCGGCMHHCRKRYEYSGMSYYNADERKYLTNS